jgi:DNA-binding NtrC family response regulator
MEQPKQTVLCVDDNTDNCELLTFVFELQGFEVVICESLEECSIEIRKRKFSAIILDNHFGDTTSLEVCKEIRDFDSNMPIIFYSGEARPKEIEKAMQAGANAYLVKPTDFDKLTDTVIKLIKEREK